MCTSDSLRPRGKKKKDPVDLDMPGSSVHGIIQQENWSGLPFPSPGDIRDLWIRLGSSTAPALTGRVFNH